jgi:hypothetical protein
VTPEGTSTILLPIRDIVRLPFGWRYAITKRGR